MELAALEKALSEIISAGATLVAISPQMVHFARKAVKENKLSFDVLCDPGNRVARQFGLVFSLPEDLRGLYKGFGVDLEKFNGDDSWTLPIPARLVVDQTGTVRSVQAHPDYTVRPDPLETVEVLKSISQPKPICAC